MIKAIVFDIGNVIITFDNNIFLKEISKFTNKSVSELNEIIYNPPDLPIKLETGLISGDEFFKEIVKKCNLSISKSQFMKAYTNIYAPIQTTFDLIKRLKHKYKLGLLSNTAEWQHEYGMKPFKIFDLFDTATLSFEVKAMKPDKKIFLDALNKLNLEPEECVYIDDIKEYVNAANQMGIHGIHYTSHEKLVESLRKFNINPNL